MLAPRARSNEPQTALTYHCAAITHYSLLFPLAVGVALAAFNVGLALAAALLGILVLIGVLPSLRAFRRSVDARYERSAAVALRIAVLGRMSPTHRVELDVLEGLAAGIRRRCGNGDGGLRGTPDPSLERWLGLHKLIALYAELAVTHHGNATTFCAQDRAALEGECEHVRGLLLGRDGPRDPWLERRRAILERRQETWQRAADERDFLVQGLATIGGVIRWMHELCTVVVGDSVRSEIEDVLAAWETNGAALGELSGLRGHADAPVVDPRALALGREVALQTAAARALWHERNLGTQESGHQRVNEAPVVTGKRLQACVSRPPSAAVSQARGGRVESRPHIEFVLRPPNHEARPRPASTVNKCTTERRAAERDSACSWGDPSASSDGFGASAGDSTDDAAAPDQAAE
jgi:hypothetical protein